MCLFAAAPAAAAAGAGAATAATAATTAMSASTALQIAGTAVSFAGQQSQGRASQRLADQGAESALKAYEIQTGQAFRRLVQERMAAAQEISEVARQSRRAQSTATVSAGEAGVGGKSVDALLDDFERQELFYAEDVRTNLGFTEANIQDQLESFRVGAQGRIQGLQSRVIQRPSFLGAALRIGGQVADYYADIPDPDAGASSGTNYTPYVNPYTGGSGSNQPVF